MPRLLLLILFIVFTAIAPVRALDRYVLMWQVQKTVTDQDLELMKSKGINLIQAFTMPNWREDEIQAYLDKAAAHGMGVIFPLMPLLKVTYTETAFDRERATVLINRWKSHPALFAWHTVDDPTGFKRRFSGAFQEKLYMFVKNLDPKHKVFISGNWAAEKDYACCFNAYAYDIVGIQAYGMNAEAEKENPVDEFLKHHRNSAPMIITLIANDLLPGGLQRQYDDLFKKRELAPNVGFYGWQLNPGKKSFTSSPDMLEQFLKLKD